MQEGSLVEAKMGALGVGVIVAVREDEMAYVYFQNQDGSDAKKFRLSSLQESRVESPELQSMKFNGSPETGYSRVKQAKVAKSKAKKAEAAEVVNEA